MSDKNHFKKSFFDIKRPFYLRALGLSIFVSIFLIVFRPLSLKLDTIWHLYIYLGLGLVIFATLLFNQFIVFPILRKYIPFFKSREKLYLYRVIITTWMIASLVASIFVYLNLFQSVGETEVSNLGLLLKIILIGTIPFALAYLAQQRRSLRRQIFLMHDAHNIKGADNIIHLQSENGKDHHQFRTENVLYIKAEDNYVSVYFKSSNEIKEVLIRLTLSALEDILEGKSIIRCHRSYMVNMRNVRQLHGRAKKSFIELNDSAFKIPVSRSYIQLVRDRMRLSTD